MYVYSAAGLWHEHSVTRAGQYADPQWNLVIEFGVDQNAERSKIPRTTTVTWGPWADRQRYAVGDSGS